MLTEQKQISLQTLLMFPTVIVAASFFASIEGIPGILAWVAQTALHELGHTAIFWAQSTLAVPAYIATVPLYNGSSIPVFIFLVGLSAWCIRQSGKNEFFFLRNICAGFLMLLVIFTILVPARQGEMLMLIAGLGGELVLGTLCMLSFFSPMPQRFNWKINRYLFLIIGALSFSGSALRWVAAQRDRSRLPMGAMLDVGLMSGQGESSGDLDRLIREFGWTQDSLLSLYTSITLICLVTLLGFHFLQWRNFLLQERPNSELNP